MQTIRARVESTHIGAPDTLEKRAADSIEFALDGVIGDRHRAYERECWQGDKQAAGTQRRNERHWSAVSLEELADISNKMNLSHTLTASDLGANLCLSGCPNLSHLPKGSILLFPSGAELEVEEYNPPCHDMGKSLAQKYQTKNAEALSTTAFSKAAQIQRGVVGVVEVAGHVAVGDWVEIKVYQPPSWLQPFASNKA